MQVAMNFRYVAVIVLVLFLALLISFFISGPTGFAIAKNNIPKGFGSPYDVVSGDQIVSARYERGQIIVDVNNAQLVYYKGYYWDGNAWKEFFFSNNKGMVNVPALASIPAKLPSGTGYVAVFACEKDEFWKCGCASSSECNMWQLQSFDVPSANNIIGGATLTVDKTSAQAGDTIEVLWDNSEPMEKDWIGVAPFESGWLPAMDWDWKYTKGIQKGSVKLKVPKDISKVQFVYYQDDGFTELGRSSIVNIRGSGLPGIRWKKDYLIVGSQTIGEIDNVG